MVAQGTERFEVVRAPTSSDQPAFFVMEVKLIPANRQTAPLTNPLVAPINFVPPLFNVTAKQIFMAVARHITSRIIKMGRFRSFLIDIVSLASQATRTLSLSSRFSQS